jgi:hypothetical protein
MVNITKFRCSWNKFQTYVVGEATFNHNLNITPNELRYTFTHVETGDVYFDFNITLDEFKSNSRFSEQSWWGIADLAFNSDKIANIGAVGTLGNPDLVTLNKDEIVSLLDISGVTKRRYLTMKHEDGTGQCPIRIFVPSAADDFTQFAYQVNYPVPAPEGETQLHTVTTTCNLPDANIVMDTGIGGDGMYQPGWKWFFCPITITTTQSTVNAGDTIECTVTLSDPSYLHVNANLPYLQRNYTDDSRIDWELSGTSNKVSKVYLEAIAGSVDRTVVSLTNGVGKFNISTLGFSAGDEIQVKAGHKMFSGVTKFTKTLS